MPCGLLLLSLAVSGRQSSLDHGCFQPSCISGQCSVKSAWPVQTRGLQLQQQKSQRVMEAAALQGVGAPLHPRASSSPGCAEEPVYGSASSLGLPLSPRVHTCVLACVGTLPFRGDPETHWTPLSFLWCRMFNVMTCSTEAMCCHNVTSLNKVFRAVFTEPEHEQQNPPITVSFCVVVKVSNVSNFLW